MYFVELALFALLLTLAIQLLFFDDVSELFSC